MYPEPLCKASRRELQAAVGAYEWEIHITVKDYKVWWTSSVWSHREIGLREAQRSWPRPWHKSLADLQRTLQPDICNGVLLQLCNLEVS